MNLDANCVRDVLLKIEELQKYFVNDDGDVEKNVIWLDQLCAVLPQHGKEDIFYTLSNLDQAGYINCTTQWVCGCVSECIVNHITYAGHEFLESIRDSKQWTAVKKGLNAIKNYSLSAISAVANGVTSAAINAYISKN